MDKLPPRHNLSREQKIELIQLLEEKQRRENVYRYKRFYKSRYPWQKKFIAATAKFTTVLVRPIPGQE